MLKLLPLVYSAGMLALLLLPPSFFGEIYTQVPAEVSGLKTENWIHMSLFFGFVMCWLLAKYPPKAVLFLTLFAAVSSEVLQGVVGRTPDLMDFFFNVSGMFIAYGVWQAIVGLKPVHAMHDAEH